MLSLALFSLLFFTVHAFKTDKCEHTAVATALVDLNNCKNVIDRETVTEDIICGPFRTIQQCISNHIDGCLDNLDVEKVTNQTLAQIRKEFAKVILESNSKYINNTVFNLLLDTCPNVPDEDYTNNMKKNMFDVIEVLETDNNCTEDQIIKFNTDIPICLEKETERAINIFGNKNSYSTSYSTREACSVLERTVGQCLLTPNCFSDRELLTLSKIMSKFLKEIYTLIITNVNTGSKTEIALKKCHAFTKENIFSASRMVQPCTAFLMITAFFLFLGKNV